MYPYRALRAENQVSGRQTLVTPLADIRRFLDEFEQADLLRC